MRLIITLILIIVAGDQFAKHLARAHLNPFSYIELVGGHLQLVLTQNSGSFLSLGAQFPAWLKFVILIIGMGSALCVALILLFTHRRQLSRVTCYSAALIIAGGLANWIDRIAFSGSVTDFMILSLGPFHTGVFNFADVAIMIGALLLFWSLWRNQSSKEQPISIVPE